MEELFEKALKENLWFYSPYQGIWFTPDELKEKQDKGTFRWGPQNFELRDPNLKVKQLQDEIQKLEKELIQFENRISRNTPSLFS